MPDLEDLPAAGLHHTTTDERGSFVSARCTCGWRGPARRSREGARADARAHPTTAATEPAGT